jgi:hypothetical protein
MGMSFLPRPARPSKAWADLKAVMGEFNGQKWAFAAAALIIPVFFICLILLDTKTAPYKEPEVTYVRSIVPKGVDDSKIRAFHDARAKELAAQIDKAKKDQEANRKAVVAIGEALDSWGL